MANKNVKLKNTDNDYLFPQTKAENIIDLQTAITSSSTDTQVASAKAVYDLVVGGINGSY